jgi:hypothetical protein
MYSGCNTTASFSYVTERGEEKMESGILIFTWILSGQCLLAGTVFIPYFWGILRQYVLQLSLITKSKGEQDEEESVWAC